MIKSPMTFSESCKVPAADPFYFRVNEASCLGWFHASAAPRRGLGVVMCRPIGYESNCAYGAYTQLAEQLALCGFDVLRFDYPGTGDSSGDDSQPNRVQSWIDSIVCATRELSVLSGNSHVCLFGLRLGVTLAAHAARRMGGVAKIVMWAPCASGRAFARELRAAASNHNRNKSSESSESGLLSTDMESLGFLYTAQTMADLDALPGLPDDEPLADHVLILDRDDRPGGNELFVNLQRTGVDAVYAVAPGYSFMMSEPRETLFATETILLIKAWLLKDLNELIDVKAVESDHPVDQTRLRQHQFEDLRETAVSFGAASTLFGILSEPDLAPERSRTLDTAILMLNVGGNHRIGPNRIYVHIARELAHVGCRTLRFDLAGLGDSRCEGGFQWSHLYSRDTTPDVRAAIDLLSRQGCKNFYVMGICSGSFVAFQAALGDPRVTGQILMNSRLLERCDAAPDGAWRNSMQKTHKSVAFYRRHFLDWQIYKRILTGDADVVSMANRLRFLISAHLKRALKSVFLNDSSEDGPLQKVRNLSRRGVDTLMIVNEYDDGRDYLEFHFGAGGKYLKDDSRFQMIFVADSDHTFSDKSGQKSVISTIKTHLGLHKAMGSG
jgi:alpha-beta hydrolase superfamily lysophospholipase